MMTNEQNGASYYLARVEITEVPQDLQDQIDLYPGMPAEVMIATGERTFFEYLIAPIARSFRSAGRAPVFRSYKAGRSAEPLPRR